MHCCLIAHQYLQTQGPPGSTRGVHSAPSLSCASLVSGLSRSRLRMAPLGWHSQKNASCCLGVRVCRSMNARGALRMWCMRGEARKYACLVLSDQRPVAAAKFSAAHIPRVLVTGRIWGHARPAETCTDCLDADFLASCMEPHAPLGLCRCCVHPL